MNHSQARIVASSLPPRPRPAAPVPDPALRDLLEANLQALRALHTEHRQMIHAVLRVIDADQTALRDALLAIGSRRAPWVQAMEETRALLFVALREVIAADHIPVG
jgi:hypothetical protein